MLRNISLTDEVRMELVNVATKMAQAGKNFERIKKGNVEGRLQSDWKSACLGSFGGIKFEAEIETELGTGKVVFLVDEDVLSSGRIFNPENSFWTKESSGLPGNRSKAAYYN